MSAAVMVSRRGQGSRHETGGAGEWGVEMRQHFGDTTKTLSLSGPHVGLDDLSRLPHTRLASKYGTGSTPVSASSDAGGTRLRGGSPVGRRSLPVGAGPNQMETFFAFHLDQGGVDRSGEARVVQLDREVFAAFCGDLLPAAPSSTLCGAPHNADYAENGIMRSAGLEGWFSGCFGGFCST